MKVDATETFPTTDKGQSKSREHQEQARGSKFESGLSEEQLETLKQVSSLVAMFQKEALNEKQIRLLAQLKAHEKDRLASDAWEIIAALKKEKGYLETQVEKLKTQNSKLTTAFPDGSERSQVNAGETCCFGWKSPVNSNGTGTNIRDELSKLLCREKLHQCSQEDKELKETQAKVNSVPDATSFASSDAEESSHFVDRTENIASKESLSQKLSPPQEFRDQVAGVCGLKNLGNTCFVNAGVQCLFSVKSFCRFFLGGGHKAIGQNDPKPSLSNSLGDLINKVWSGSYVQCDPTDLYTAITACYPNQLSRQTQHDCHEFLTLFLERLHQELNCKSPHSPEGQCNESSDAEERWRQYTRNNESLVVDTFQGQLQSTVTCSCCSYKAIKYHPFTFLPVPLLSESFHTFVITWISNSCASDGETVAVRYKVQVTKPSTVFKLKTNFLSLFADQEKLQTDDIIVSVVRDSRIISIMDDDKQLTPFSNRRIKFYIIKPLRALEYLNKESSTMNHYPEPVGTSEHMSVFNHSEPRDDKHHLTRRTNLSTSTPKTPLGQKTRASLSTVYRLSGTCRICLRKKADQELVSHDKCGGLFCYQCMQEAAGGVIENQLTCPKCIKQDVVAQSCGETQPDKSRMIIVPVMFRRFEEDSKTKRLFGHPNLIKVPTSIRGNDLYTLIAKLLLEPESSSKGIKDLSSAPFTLHLVDQQGRNCSRCFKINGCTGCEANGNSITNFQSCDNLAVQLVNISRWEAERMRRSIDHESMWRPRNTEDSILLQDCLKTFVENEKLPDTWFCQNCHEERTASKCLSVYRLPDTLIIHLKRYSQNGVKVTTPVVFPLEGLDMSEYTHLDPCEQCLYDLTGCVYHQGSYLSGHYTAYTHTNGVWYRYDDEQVTKEIPSNLCCAQAYILFYHRRAVSSLSPSGSNTEQFSEDKCTGFSEELETENTKHEGDLPRSLLQSSAKSTSRKIKDEPDQNLALAQHADLQDYSSNPNTGGTMMQRFRRSKLKTKQERTKELKRNSEGKEPKECKPNDSQAYGDRKLTKCSCQQCKYFKLLEKQIKITKYRTGEQQASGDVLATARNDEEDTNSWISTATQSSSADWSETGLKDTAVQVTINEHLPPHATNISKQLNDKCRVEDAILPEVETLSKKLKCAIENENIRRVLTLLKRGADPNSLISGLSALHTAVGLDSPLNVRFTRLLLDYGGDPDIPSANGLTPIHIAAMWNRVNCLKLLLDRGGNPYRKDKEGSNALKLARAFQDDTSADTSELLAKLDDRICKQLKEGSLSSVSLNSNFSSSGNTYPQFTPVSCGFSRKKLGRRASVRTVTRKVSRNFRRVSGHFRRGIGRIRSFLSSSSGSRSM